MELDLTVDSITLTDVESFTKVAKRIPRQPPTILISSLSLHSSFYSILSANFPSHEPRAEEVVPGLWD